MTERLSDAMAHSQAGQCMVVMRAPMPKLFLLSVPVAVGKICPTYKTGK
eukprot:SAG11_NODE_512_length_8839_cov_5.600572_11_plen_49_part_00